MRRREAEEGRKVSYIETYIPHIGIALQEMLKLSEKQKDRVITTLTETLPDAAGQRLRNTCFNKDPLWALATINHGQKITGEAEDVYGKIIAGKKPT